MNNIWLTIMIPTTEDRRDMFWNLYWKIAKQIGDDPRIDIIYMEDDKSMSVGKKRDLLLEAARGEWSCCVDSDDDIADDYIESIMRSLEENPDHVGFIELCNINGIISRSTFSIKDQKWSELPNGDHIRCANPKSVIRTSIARQVGFEDMRYGEDRVFSEAVTPLLRTEVFIEKELYYYNHVSSDHYERYGIRLKAI